MLHRQAKKLELADMVDGSSSTSKDNFNHSSADMDVLDIERCATTAAAAAATTGGGGNNKKKAKPDEAVSLRGLTPQKLVQLIYPNYSSSACSRICGTATDDATTAYSAVTCSKEKGEEEEEEEEDEEEDFDAYYNSSSNGNSGSGSENENGSVSSDTSHFTERMREKCNSLAKAATSSSSSSSSSSIKQDCMTAEEYDWGSSPDSEEANENDDNSLGTTTTAVGAVGGAGGASSASNKPPVLMSTPAWVKSNNVNSAAVNAAVSAAVSAAASADDGSVVLTAESIVEVLAQHDKLIMSTVRKLIVPAQQPSKQQQQQQPRSSCVVQKVEFVASQQQQ